MHSHLNDRSGIILTEAKNAGVPNRYCHSHVANPKFGFKRELIRRYFRLFLNKSVTHAFACATEIFEKKKKMATDLAEPFQHVRVDFYLVNDKIYVGELNFFHNGGITWFDPPEYDKFFGDNWKLEK